MNKVSVIIPIYNPGPYFEECVRSLMEQTMDDLELLFIDDCSTDNSLVSLRNIIAEYVDTKKNVRIIKNEKNIGCCATRKKGVELAQGEYIAFCDNDDILDPKMYELLYELSIREGYDMTYCDVIWRYERYDYYQKIDCEINKKDLLNEILIFGSGGICGSLWNRIFKSDLFRNNNIIFPQKQIHEDVFMSFQLVYYSNKIGYIDQALYYWRQNESSVSHYLSNDLKVKKRANAKENCELLNDFIKKIGLNKSLQKGIFTNKELTRKLFLNFDCISDFYQWYRTYPFHSFLILFLKNTPIRHKLGYIKKQILLSFKIFKTFV